MPTSEQKKKLLKAKIAIALHNELGRVHRYGLKKFVLVKSMTYDPMTSPNRLPFGHRASRSRQKCLKARLMLA